MSERSTPRITTHDWGKDLDLAHLATVRERLGQGEVAGGRRHLILEVLTYADEEAESLGRTGTPVVTHHPDGSITVADDGRGTDTRVDAGGRVVRKPVMATPDVRFRGGGRRLRCSPTACRATGCPRWRRSARNWSTRTID